MVFTDWMGLAKKDNTDSGLIKPTEEYAGTGMRALGNASVARKPPGSVADPSQASSKILMVQDGEYHPQITEYAMNMARRLSCAIIALDIGNKPLQFSGDKKIRESDLFIEKARKNGMQFVAQAQTRGIRVTHVMDIGNSDEIIDRILKHDASIRYMLNQPTSATSQHDQNIDKVPVVSLHCFQPQKVLSSKRILNLSPYHQ